MLQFFIFICYRFPRIDSFVDLCSINLHNSIESRYYSFRSAMLSFSSAKPSQFKNSIQKRFKLIYWLTKIPRLCRRKIQSLQTGGFFFAFIFSTCPPPVKTFCFSLFSFARDERVSIKFVTKIKSSTVLNRKNFVIKARPVKKIG